MFLLNLQDNISAAINHLGHFYRCCESVRHGQPRTLIEKLEILGVRGIALTWFESYLANRCQYESSSSLKFIKYGDPQGSILGPLLFYSSLTIFRTLRMCYNTLF